MASVGQVFRQVEIPGHLAAQEAAVRVLCEKARPDRRVCHVVGIICQMRNRSRSSCSVAENQRPNSRRVLWLPGRANETCEDSHGLILEPVDSGRKTRSAERFAPSAHFCHRNGYGCAKMLASWQTAHPVRGAVAPPTGGN